MNRKIVAGFAAAVMLAVAVILVLRRRTAGSDVGP